MTTTLNTGLPLHGLAQLPLLGARAQYFVAVGGAGTTNGLIVLRCRRTASSTIDSSKDINSDNKGTVVVEEVRRVCGVRDAVTHVSTLAVGRDCLVLYGHGTVGSVSRARLVRPPPRFRHQEQQQKQEEDIEMTSLKSFVAFPGTGDAEARRTGACAQTAAVLFRGPGARVLCAVGARDGRVRLLDVAPVLSAQRVLPGPDDADSGPVACLAHRNERLVGVAGAWCCVWDTAAGTLLHAWRAPDLALPPDTRLCWCALSADGERVLAAAAAPQPHLRDARAWLAQRSLLGGHADDSATATVIPDARSFGACAVCERDDFGLENDDYDISKRGGACCVAWGEALCGDVSTHVCARGRAVCCSSHHAVHAPAGHATALCFVALPDTDAANPARAPQASAALHARGKGRGRRLRQRADALWVLSVGSSGVVAACPVRSPVHRQTATVLVVTLTAALALVALIVAIVLRRNR